MAEPAVGFLLESLSQLIIQEADQLSTVRVEIRSIEEEFEFMASLVERSEENHDKMISYINEAETLIEEYATIATERAMAGIYKAIIYQKKQRRCAKKLNDFIVKVRDFKSTLTERAGGGDHEVPRYLWRFIFYILLFPADLEIPVRRLILLWVAEGLIRYNENRDDEESVEDIAERDLNMLINLGIVRVTRKKPNGKAQACLLVDGAVTYEIWLMKAKKANFFQSRTEKLRRLVYYTAACDAGESSFRIHRYPDIFESVTKCGDAISFLSFYTQEGGENIGNFVHKCILAERLLWLRVLDLEGVFRPKFSDTLGKLIRLKYLGLRRTDLLHLPYLVNKFLKLQLLDVKHTYISLLPRSIWRMKDLRHLYLSEDRCTRFPHRPSGEVTLTQLQTLWGAFIDEDTHVVKGLDTLEGIRKLGLSCRPRSMSSSHHMSKQLEAVDKWISKQGRLQSLRLKSRDKIGDVADLHLTTLEENTNLSTVYLLGKLHPHVVEKFPPSLIDITLSGSRLDMDPMVFLGKIPKLRILRFLANSVVHPKLQCSGGSFPQLKVVHIWCLYNLEEWQVEEGSLACLESFEIRSCPNLKNLPAQLQYLDTLDKFRLTKMPEGFMHKTEMQLPQLWAKIDHVDVEG